MIKTVYQKPEIRDSNDNIIQQGAFGKNTALANATNDGWIDYVANDLEFLYDLAKDEVVPVSALPAGGDMNKTYLLTTTGVCYRWDGTAWVEISSSEAVGRAETAANLAEQWATKTNGTVDGSEYSAKYYANAAQQSADDAQDVADDMATHLSQIDQNTGGVSANSKRISNIEKLLQGNLYDYQTDSTSAYTKTVPSGAMPYAGLESLGGKTLVWNQINKNEFMSQTVADVVFTNNNDGSWTANGTATADSSKTFSSELTMINGHKYFMRCYPDISGCSIDISGVGVDTGSVKIINWSFSTGHAYILNFRFANGTVFNNIKIYPWIIDLTLMFGAGNEPSTVAEFESMFPADYYAYNEGTLLSAGVTDVVSQGKNLAYYGDGVGVPSDTTFTDSTKRIFPIGKYIVGISSDNYYVPSQISAVSTTNNSVTLTTIAGGYGVGIPFACNGGDKITISTSTTAFSNMWSVLWYGADGSLLHYDYFSNQVLTLTAWSGAKQGLLVLRPTVNTPTTYSNIQIEKSESASAYSPAFINTYPIPTAIRNLEGYGWSAGTAYNYIDFEAKKFVKCVDRVDMGTLSWYTSFDMWRTSGISYALKIDSTAPNLLNAKYPAVAWGNRGEGKMVIDNSWGVYVGDSTYADATAFKTAMSGVYLYYELKTPVETDISQYLTDDNLIQVEAGGTLTFENSNGDDYRLPVPSTEEYMIDLQSAIGG